jgi:adenine deaminase
MKLGATDHNVRLAMEAGLPLEIAVQLVTINPARHMRLTPWVGSIAPGRFADLVLLDNEKTLGIGEVWADGQKVSSGKIYTAEVPKIDWPEWATTSVNIQRKMTAADFAIVAPDGRESVNAALLRPFHWHDEFITAELPVVDGLVQRDSERNITKFAIVDRFSGEGRTARMFCLLDGP